MTEHQNLLAKRLQTQPSGKGENRIFKFERISMAKKKIAQERPDLLILDFGVGESIDTAPEPILEVMKKEVGLYENRGYTDNGIPVFQEAVSVFMQKMFQVSLDPKTEIMHGLGAKSILQQVAAMFIDAGDILIQTEPGYPVLKTWTKYLGGEVFSWYLKKEHQFIPHIPDIPKDIAKKAKLIYVNSPNNPTGKMYPESFWKELILFAKENHLMIIHDNAYSAFVYKDAKPFSLLSIEGSKEVVIEIQSLSKLYNMTGWRLAFIAGKEDMIRAYGTIKQNTDAGQFAAIQKAGAYALHHPELIQNIYEVNRRRLQKMVQVLQEIGFSAQMPDGTFFLYLETPKSAQNGEVVFESAEDFSAYCIEKVGIVTVPWTEAGNFVRFSSTFEIPKGKTEDFMIQELKQRLQSLQLRF